MIQFNKKISSQIILFTLILSSIIFVLPNIPNSYAHAFVTKTDPYSGQSLSSQPTKVDAYFSDPIDIHYSQLKVLNSSGSEVQNNDLHYINNDQTTLSVSLSLGLKNGIYTITTKVLDQTDGHVTEDFKVFAIGQSIPQNFNNTLQSKSYQEISIPETFARFPALIGQVMVVGISFATLWLWRPISKISWLGNALTESRTKIDRKMIELMVIGSIIVLSSGFAMISVQAYSINAGILDAISTKFGSIWILRMIASALLLVFSFLMYQKIKKSGSNYDRRNVAGLFGIGLVLLATTSLISHGAATGQTTPLILDFIHNLVASIWIGGLFYIAFILMPNLKQLANENIGLSTLSILIPRFSTIIVTILGAIVITGPFLLYSLENNLALTLVSTYGKILIVKLSLAAAMIILGAYNQTIVHKRALNATRTLITENRVEIIQNTVDAKSILFKFNKTTKIEALIGIALIASVAVLVDSGVPSSEFQDQLQTIQDQNVFALASSDNIGLENGLTETKFVENGSRIVLAINPFYIGNNNFKISFFDSNKKFVDMKSVQIRLTQTDKGIGPNTIDAKQISKGVFSASTAFGFPGHWNLQVEGIQNKENSLNLVGSFDLLVKPSLDSLDTNIKEFKMPDNGSLPFYPVFDSERNVVWVGDSLIKSQRIFEFDLNSKKFIEHKIEGINIVSSLILDSSNMIWYTDPVSKLLGNYNPDNKTNNIFKVPTQGIISGITIDSSNNIWLIDSNNELLKFDPIVKNFTSIKLGSDAQPLGITMDKSTGLVWIAEGIGKIASINPMNYKIVEYAPRGQNVTLATPTGIIADPETGNIYVSEHDGYAISVFNPLLKTFKKYTLDSHGLPLGMIFDNYHNLWVAQHTLDKIAVVDPRTGFFREFNIPSSNSFVQWITLDSQGNIIMAEQRANALGVVTTTINPASSQNNQENQTGTLPAGIPNLGFSYADMVAPSIAGLLIAVAFFYSKSASDLKRSIKQANKKTN